jgi:NADH-quinone oxidoreductase chain G
VEKTLSNISCTINDYPYQVLAGSTILKACEQSGLLIPRFCYHDRLSIAGNCRMCLVQLDKAAKPVASCALEVSLGMKIYTNTSLVKKAREGVMEFLLANHPLDCPICDQGGECDLQDQALIFGNDRGRFYETKRAVVDKDWGHLIKTIMTRCIHCTRCQRFSTELSGRPEILMVGRGSKSEISNFIMNLVKSEVSGNVIDLCPVGALTSKPYAFTARPWELRKVYSIDLTDSLHSSLVYQIGKQRILRVLPVLNKELNEEWLADRSRYSYDGFRLQRIAQPFAIDQDSMETLEWEVAFLGLLFQVGPFFGLSALLGELSLQSSYLAAKLETFSTNEILDNDQRSTYFLNSKYVDLPRSDLIVLVGTDLKRELPLLAGETCVLSKLNANYKFSNLELMNLAWKFFRVVQMLVIF